MRIVMTIMLRDEIDVLPVMLEAHLALGVDHIVATDNGSTDGSAELLGAYAERGVLTLLEGDTTEFDQAAAVTAMARHAATELGADWVLNADADEVWWPVAGTLPDVLTAVPEEFGIVVVPRNDFPPAPEGPAPFWDRMRVRESAGRSVQGVRLVPKVAHRARADAQVAFGNHDVHGDRLAWAPPLPLLEILHFPARSYEQLERKVRALVTRRATSGMGEGIVRDALTLHDKLEQGTLRAWYDGLYPAGQAGLADGSFVRDDRLAELAASGFERRPSDPSATVALRDRFATFIDWDVARGTAAERYLRVALAERDECLSRIAELEALRDLLDGQLEADRVVLRQTLAELEQLKRSRALRAAAAARRALGR